MEAIKRYWEKATPMSFSPEKWDYEKKRKFRYELQDYMQEVFEFDKWAGKSVLEIGCGSGIDAVEFARNGAIVVAIDITDNAIKFTKRLAKEARVPITVVKQNKKSIPYKDNVFDCIYCTTGDTIIPGDYQEISNIKIGDKAMGSQTLGCVTQKFVHDYNGLMYKIKVSGLLPFCLTPEHPLLIATGEVFHRYKKIAKREFSEPYWKMPKEIVVQRNGRDGHIKSRDYVVIPRLRGNTNIIRLDLSPFILNKRSKSLFAYYKRPLKIYLTKDIMWLFGLFVAEGSTHKGHIMFSLHQKEIGIHSKATKIINQLGYKTHTVINKNNKGMCLSFNSRLLARAFREWFGGGSLSRQIPDFIILHNNLEFIAEFVKSYEQGDGCFTNGIMSIGTVSKILAMQLQLIYARLGFFAKIYPCKIKQLHIMGREIKHKNRLWYNVIYDIIGTKYPARHFITDDYIYAQISSVESIRHNGKVYNIATTDHTYLTANAIVHNCYGVLHHIPDVDSVLKEAQRLLKTGGTIMAMLYHKDSILWAYSILKRARKKHPRMTDLQATAFYSERNEGCPYTKAYTKQEAVDLFSRYFKDVKVSVHHNVVDLPQQRKVKLEVSDEYELGWHLVVKAVK